MKKIVGTSLLFLLLIATAVAVHKVSTPSAIESVGATTTTRR